MIKFHVLWYRKVLINTIYQLCLPTDGHTLDWFLSQAPVQQVINNLVGYRKSVFISQINEIIIKRWQISNCSLTECEASLDTSVAFAECYGFISAVTERRWSKGEGDALLNDFIQ